MLCGFGPGLWLQSLCTLWVFKVLLDGCQGLVCVCVCTQPHQCGVWVVIGMLGGSLL